MTLAYIGQPGCCCDGGGGGTVTPIGCFACTAIPSALIMRGDIGAPPCGSCPTGTACNEANKFQSTTLTYSTVRNGWISPDLFVPHCNEAGCANAEEGGIVRYLLLCDSSLGQFTFYVDGSTPPFSAPVARFGWNIGGSNTCHPFNLSVSNSSFGGGFGWLGPICGTSTIVIHE